MKKNFTQKTRPQGATNPQIGPRHAAIERNKPGRITGLDVARGWFLILSVTSAAVLYPRPEWLSHARWLGVTPYDLIFPLFVTLSGVGMAFAYKNRVSHWVTLRRVSVLTVVGIIYTAVAGANYNPHTLRFTGTLQLYAVLVAALALAHLVARTWRAWALITVVAAVGTSYGLHWWAGRCPGGQLSPTCNPSATIDTFLLGTHMYAAGNLGHDPEGLVAITGAIITACVGTTAGHLALASRGKHWNKGPGRLAAWAAGVATLGFVLTWLVPAFKRLWTPSFSLLTAAVGVGIFAVAFWLFDVPKKNITGEQTWALASPFVALGRNSLLIYFGSHLLVDIASRSGLQPVAGTAPGPDGQVALDPLSSVAHHVAALVDVGPVPGLGFVVLNLALWWILALFLHSRRIYIHA